MNSTPISERKRIVFLGRCNAGKSSLVNAVAGQNVAVVSEKRGTTTDPVRKAMELLPVGPVLLCDTPGLDDTSEIGSLRMERTRAELRQADLAVIVFEASSGFGDFEKSILDEVKALSIPFLLVSTKSDLLSSHPAIPSSSGRAVCPQTAAVPEPSNPSLSATSGRACRPATAAVPEPSNPSLSATNGRACRPATAAVPEPSNPSLSATNGRACRPATAAVPEPPASANRDASSREGAEGAKGSAPRADARAGEPLSTSAITGAGIENLKLQIIKALPEEACSLRLAADLAPSGAVAVLVVPIDSAAPKGRLILPQQQVIRDLLDNGVIPVVTRDTEFETALQALKEPPAVVITDSQAFASVSAKLPQSIPLTSFSILFARYKGDLSELLKGAAKVSDLKDGDKILIAEGCTHHRQGDDIGTVKIPRLLSNKTGKKLVFEHTAGMLYPDNLSEYALVIHCGGCMLSRREMLYRIECAKKAGVPIVNYGVILALLNGILERVVKCDGILGSDPSCASFCAPAFLPV